MAFSDIGPASEFASNRAKYEPLAQFAPFSSFPFQLTAPMSFWVPRLSLLRVLPVISNMAIDAPLAAGDKLYLIMVSALNGLG